MQRLAGKVALITGGNSGIGLATARLFVAEGARVAITGRDARTLEQAAAELGAGVLAIQADVTVAADRQRTMVGVQERFGRLDVVFANAGITAYTPLGSADPELFERILSINVTGTFFTVQDALPLLQDRGSVILTSSVVPATGSAGYSAYAASKAGIRAMARVLAAELSGRGIRVNAVTPGTIQTPIWERSSIKGQAAAMVSIASRIVPLGRMGQAEEIARAVLYLASEESSYMQGSELVVDGGLSELPAGAPLFRRMA